MSAIINVPSISPTASLARLPMPEVARTAEREASDLSREPHAPVNQEANHPLNDLELSRFQMARIAAIREEIAAGTYETPERIYGTVSRLLDVFA